MYLNIEIEGSEKAYSFADNQVVKIGRSPDCEIQLLVEGISRVHMHVIHENGEYYVIDQGSTNGSFINDEKLEAQIKTPFNSFFPVKLGFNVYLSLLDEVNVSDLKNIVKETQDKDLNNPNSKSVKPSENQSSITRTSQFQSSEGRTNSQVKVNELKANKNKKPEGSFKKVLVSCVACLVLFFSYPYLSPLIFEEEVTKAPLTPLRKPKTQGPSKEVKKTDIVEENLVKSSLTHDKCLNDLEKYFCEQFEIGREKSYYEGFYYFLGNLYLTIFESTLKKSYTNFELNEVERREVLLIARRKFKKDFDLKKFMTEDHLRLEKTSEKEALYGFIFMELINKDYYAKIVELKDFKNFYFVVAKNSHGSVEEVDYLEINAELYKKIIERKENIIKAIRFLMTSGYNLPFSAEMKVLGLKGF